MKFIKAVFFVALGVSQISNVMAQSFCGANVPPLNGSSTIDGIWRSESRILTCADAYRIPVYAKWMNAPNIRGRVVPNGWRLMRQGVILGIATDGWVNAPLHVGNELLGYGYVLEVRQIKVSENGTVVDQSSWVTAKLASCDITNPESYVAP